MTAHKFTEATPMGALAVYQFDAFRVRIIDRDGSPWFVAKDVCEALEIKNASDAISRLDQDERGTIGISDSVNGHSLLILSESGLYALILRCQGAMTEGTPAHRFRKWVTDEVLPSIRKRGNYGASMPQGPELLALAIIEAQRLIAAKDAKIAEDAPKVEVYDRLIDARGSYTMSEVAKMLGFGPVNFGRMLEADGYVFRRSQRWMPVQRYVDAGWFVLKTMPVGDDSKGQPIIVEQIRVTATGLSGLSQAYPGRKLA